MALTRLENFIKNVEGNILYVNANDLDASDSILNQGNSLTRPFKSIQRALIEAARFSYLTGSNNDKFDKTTIIVYPGEYVVDNRPGYTVYDSSGTAVYKDVNDNTIASYLPTGLTETSNFELNQSNNILYTFNSSSGGVIIPRGTSIVGMDLRKTKIRPLFVPDPEDSNISRTALFKITGACYFSQFTIFDADPNGFCYKNYTTTRHTPLFSHHKITTFEYADGINKIGTTDLTDLQMYYYKVAQAFGADSGRSIGDFPTTSDFEPKIDEYRIVAEVSPDDLTITSISASGTTVTVTTSGNHNLQVDTPIRIIGITEDSTIYNGSFIVTQVNSTTEFEYTTTSAPTATSPTSSLPKVVVESDSVSSASPYILNCTLRSVYGMCGMHADGSKATGFKSMVVAQFTGVSLQKDDNAFLKYDNGSYKSQSEFPSSQIPLHLDGESVFDPSYAHFHIKTSNAAIIQAVSIFAIGYSEQFLAESGGDQSVTNSNSNFGALALKSNGFRVDSFDKDDTGYITHIIPPQENSPEETNIPWLSLDTTSIINAGVGYTDKLYLDGLTDSDTLPPYNVDSFKIGARSNDLLYVNLNISGVVTTFSAPIIMQGSTSSSFEKSFNVFRSGSLNGITSNETITLTENHNFTTGEKVTLFAENGVLPDGLDHDTIYYAVSVGSTTIKLSESFNNATSLTPITISNIQTNGGKFRVVSRVSDKKPGEYGHPIQYDSVNSKWYLQSTSTNGIRSGMISIGVTAFNLQSPVTYVKRKEDGRSLSDRIYRVRYVIPKDATNARIPSDGFILQESSTVLEDTTSSVSNSTQLRNPKIIAAASWSGSVATVRTEIPHGLLIGDDVKISKVTSGINTGGTDNLGFNGIFTVLSAPTTKTFTYALTTDPGSFTNDISTRGANLPTVSRNKFTDIFSVFRTEIIQAHVPSKRDGIYHLTILKGSVSPTSSQFSNFKFNQPIRNFYPSQDRDNYNSDPEAAKTVAINKVIGKTVLNDLRNSITKESVQDLLRNTNIAIGVTSVVSTGTSATLYSSSSHGLNPAVKLSLVAGGTGYATTNTNLILSGGTGEGLSINVTSTSGGAITGWKIIDGGSGYSAGTAVTATTAGSGGATFNITEIRNDIGKAVQIVGVTTTGYGGELNPYNTVSRITSVSGTKEFTYGISTTGGTYSSGGQIYISDKTVGITSIVYDSSSGIATVSTGSTAHGLFVSNKFHIVGTSQTQYNGTYVVSSRIGLTTFTTFIGKELSLPSYNQNSFVAKNTITSHGDDSGIEDENIGSRLIPIYAKQSTNTTGTILPSATSVGVSTIADFKKGDYIQINEEVIRISDTPSGSTLTIIRGALGTIAQDHDSGSEVRKISVVPVELRRPSFIRASNHTFEYMGFGPGNYSTALPQRQSKVPTKDEQLLSQKKSESGGVVVYTGMNDSGDFYIGNKRLSSNTAQEETLEAPVFEYYGEPSNQKKLSAIFDDVNVRESLKVDGGSGNNVRSEFNGPLLLTNKTTSTSTIEAKSLLVKGSSDNPSTISVVTETPTKTGQGGDISLADVPTSGSGSYLGWVWTDSWKRFAPISTTRDSMDLYIDRLGIGVTHTSLQLSVNGSALFGSVRAGNLYVSGIATFSQAAAFSNISAGFGTFKTAAIGIATIGFVDDSGNPGSLNLIGPLVTGPVGAQTSGILGQILQSYGSSNSPVWINSSDASVGSAASIRITPTTDNDTFYPTFTGNIGVSGITTAYVRANPTSLVYNPGTVRLGIGSTVPGKTLDVAGTLRASGISTFGSDLSVGGNFEVAGISTFVGSVTFRGGTIGLGDADTDNISFTGEVNTNILPDVDVTYDLGSSAKRWKTIHVGFVTTTNLLIGVSTAQIAEFRNIRVIEGNSVVSNTTAVTATVSTTSQTPITSANLSSSTYRSAKYSIQITQGTDYQFVDVAVIHNGTTASVTEYNQITTNAVLATFDADISGGNIRLLTTQTSATSATYKIVISSITV